MYLKVPKFFICLIFLDGFWLMNITFGNIGQIIIFYTRDNFFHPDLLLLVFDFNSWLHPDIMQSTVVYLTHTPSLSHSLYLSVSVSLSFNVIYNHDSVAYYEFASWYNWTIILCNCNYYFTLLRVFHTNVSWWFLTGVCRTASVLKSPGLFIVFLPISIMLSFGWSPLFLLFSSHPVYVTTLWWLY